MTSKESKHVSTPILPTLYILCDARAACLRMAADFVREKNKRASGKNENVYSTEYVWARHKNVGTKLLDTAKKCKSNDEILIVVPQIDHIQRDLIIEAVKTMFGKKHAFTSFKIRSREDKACQTTKHNKRYITKHYKRYIGNIFFSKKIEINWYFGPKWFDDSQSICETLTNVAKELKGFERQGEGPSPHKIITFDNNEKRTPTINFKVNSFYDFVDPEKKEHVEKIRDLENYIEYQLMHLFMGNYTDASTLEAIVTALTAAKEENFGIPGEAGVSSKKMKELIGFHTRTKPSLAGRSAIFKELKERIVVLARSKSPNNSVLDCPFGRKTGR